jgi:hypothetical protein
MEQYQRLVRDIAEALYLSLQSPIPGKWKVTKDGVRISILVDGCSQDRIFEAISNGVVSYAVTTPSSSGTLTLEGCMVIYIDVLVPDSNWGDIVEYAASVARAVSAGAEPPSCRVCGSPPPRLAV